MKYIRQLDSVRGVAVLLVIIWHWFQGEKINAVPNGPMGVSLFFVLSGFLITGILLDGKNKVAGSLPGKKSYIKRFFIRRSLRIFPIYYLVITPFLIYSLTSTHPSGKYLYYLT